MPFRKYARRNYKRSKLTKSNIYLNRGAKAQSKQIAALNRKINYLAKTNRPEVLTKFVNYELTFTNGTFNENYHMFGFNPYYTSYSGDDEADADTDLQGNFNRCKGITLNLIAQYSDNWRDTIADTAHDPSAGYRVVILQYRRSAPVGGGADSITSASIFQSTSTLSSSDTNLTMPLVPGINQTFKVLYSKTFTINRYHPTRQHHIYIPARQCLNFVKEVFMSNDVSATPKGHIVVAILSGGLHHDIDYSAQIKIAATLNVAYTDN